MKKYLVILSGWAAQPFVWNPILNLLKDEYETILVDWNDICSLDDFKQKAIDAIQKKCHGRFSLMGWSLGSLVAMDIAADNMFEIERIILIGGTSRFTQNSSENYNCGWNEHIVHKMMCSLKKSPQNTMSSFYKKMFSISEIGNGFYEHFIKELMPVSTPLGSLALGLEYLIKTDFREKISNIEIPALLIHGCNDLICPVSSSEYICNHLKKSKLALFEQIGHMPFYAKPEKCCKTIDAFIKNNAGDEYDR